MTGQTRFSLPDPLVQSFVGDPMGLHVSAGNGDVLLLVACRSEILISCFDSLLASILSLTIDCGMC